MNRIHPGVIYALFSAVLFGASTPLAKILVGQFEPTMLAGLLYGGSGIGLFICIIVRRLLSHKQTSNGVTKSDLPWLAGAILFGGILGPLLLMLGLTHLAGSTASLLLNMEGVLTALLAWFIFKENFDRRIMLGMGLIIVASLLLSWDYSSAKTLSWGALAIIAACFCWAIDNNLTRKVSASDSMQIACLKGLVAGAVNTSIAFSMGYSIPNESAVLSAALVGFCGYGLSLVLFILALRHLGTARTGAYFSAAPFVGAIISLLILGETPNIIFWIAMAMMTVGIWLHLTENHDHEHEHLPMSHTHPHRHDKHHQHEHDFPWNGEEPHVHPHHHVYLKHKHAHFPDIHHQHGH